MASDLFVKLCFKVFFLNVFFDFLNVTDLCYPHLSSLNFPLYALLILLFPSQMQAPSYRVATFNFSKI